MIVLRLTRVGKRKQPTFRLIVQEKQRDPWGKALEILGSYNPRTKQNSFKTDRVKEWISKGAQPSPTVHNMLVDMKVLDSEKVRNTTGDKKKEAAEEKKA